MQKVSTIPCRGSASVARLQGLKGARRSFSSIVRKPQRSQQVVTAAIGLETVQPEVLAAGAVAAVSLVGLAAWSATQMQKQEESPEQQGSPAPVARKQPPRENAVLVLGSTGRTGKRLVQQLVASGRTVVAALQSADKASVLTELGLVEGYQSGQGGGALLLHSGVDITKPDTFTPELFEGVTQVVSCLGGRAGRLADGTFGYLPGMMPEAVEAQGFPRLLEAMSRHVSRQERSTKEVMSLTSDGDVAMWERLDDVIMGGQSASGISAMPDGSGALWRGELIMEGGGFCGTRTKKLSLDLSAYDGLLLRVKGDGQTYKFNIKTADQEDAPETTHQATFDTIAGQWLDVYLPWHAFVSVKRATADPSAPLLDPSRIARLGLVLSRFEFNKLPNSKCKGGPFELAIGGGIKAFRDPRPQIVQLSSAGVERNALIGNDAAKRKADIPIVQLNPGRVLDHKYTAELAVRATGYPYAIVRACGLVDELESTGPALIEADQGDAISGRLTRAEVASVLAEVVASPAATGKTFEIRRRESADVAGKGPMGARDYLRLLLKLSPDSQRTRVGLAPFPAPAPPPAVTAAPVTQEPTAVVKAPSETAGNGSASYEAEPSEKVKQVEEVKEKEVVAV